MELFTKEESGYKYIETDPGNNTTLLLLHGLFGALSNFKSIIDHFNGRANVVVPLLPIFELPLRKLSVTGLVDHVNQFVRFKNYTSVNLVGNSLGGHVAILFALDRPDILRSMTLTGSSGLFEAALGSTFPKRGNYDFVQKKTETTFYDPAVATKELVDEVYDIVNDRNKAIRVIAIAKSAIRHNIGDRLHSIIRPVLLVWGKDDTITPAFVGEKFHELLPDSRLFLLDKCGHAPMMEHPDEFNKLLYEFLVEVKEI
ncbi:MAG: alpha/beta hydrolase [Saprospiraceae bacterium]|uniref:Alpha/beta hydrolase n=1 Tax=Candidatus Opimibacter skivensis TaxID=2982028 RepID=A0A9D7SY00_9BACT|nr:alpha/beta hydrolase [Candidatus Opimibacter skivensis]